MCSHLISELPEPLFRDSPNLQLIDFSGNEIAALPPKLFSKLYKVEKLRFIANNLTNLDEKIFTDLDSLKVFHFHQNQLKSLPNQIFEANKLLEEINLKSNQIEFDFRNEFTKGGTFHKLKICHLADNNISYIPDGLKYNAHELEILNLTKNFISKNTAGVLEVKINCCQFI